MPLETETVETLEAAALHLTPAGRARLVERLIATLDADPEVEVGLTRANFTMDFATASSMDEREVFARVLKDSISNIILYSIAAVAIGLICRALWWAGIVLFGIFALIAVAGTLHSVIGSAMGLAMLPLAVYEKIKGRGLHIREQTYLWASSAIQLLTSAILAAYVFGLYRGFF